VSFPRGLGDSAGADSASPAESSGGLHIVQFYQEDAVLLDALAQFVSGALAAGDAVVVLATEAHRTGVAERLAARGLDTSVAITQGRYVVRDAAEVLSQIMPNGHPDAARFADVVGGIIGRAAQTITGDRSRVAVFGELVALLSARGRHAAAVQLEKLWNELARTREFSLFCAYPTEAFPRAADALPFAEICAEHARVIPAETFSSLDDEARLRAIAGLQQKARALESEIEQREHAEAALRRREEELATFIEEVPVALHWVGPDGTILWANRAELDLVGYSREEYIGRHVGEFYVDPTVAADVLARLERQETLHNYEAQLRRKDGSIRHALIDSNVFWENGEFVHTRCVTRDITDRVLRFEANTRLAAIVDSSYDAIIGKTLDGTITDWNRAAEALYGYTAAEIVGQPITTIVPLDRRDELADILARLARGEQIAHHETERVRKDGTRLEVSVSISPIRDSAGRIVGASKIARDITERRALERQKQAFLEMIAHDLGSPLTAIQAYAQLLQRRQAYSEQAVAAILGEARRMGRLASDVLATARLDAGSLELRRTPTDAVVLVGECVAQATLLSGDQCIRVEAPPHPVVGFWDRDRLTQVLTNLLDNAAKYAPDGGIVVRVTEGGDDVGFAVVDQGSGLTPDEAEHIFERFFRAGSAAGKASGVGLGLFISKHLVEAHGGRMWVESTPEQGSTFAFSLPRGSASPDSAEVHAGSADERP
jgi:PAS domain S-box-containing protein